MSEKKHGFTQMPNSFIFGHPELERHDLTVLLALTALSQGKEDFFKVPLRELAQYARVSAGLLCDSISKEKRTEDTPYREGILTKLQGLHTIEYFQKKPPKGQVQTYVRVCWSTLWEDNKAYYEDQKQEKSVYPVNTSNDNSVYPINESVYSVNTSVYPVNANSESVYPVNKSVYDACSIATHNIKDKLLKDNKDKEESSTVTAVAEKKEISPTPEKSSLSNKKEIVSPEVLTLIKLWETVEGGEYIPRTDKLIKAARALVPCKASQEDIEGVKAYCYLDNPEWFKKHPPTLQDIANNWSKWKASQKAKDATSNDPYVRAAMQSAERLKASTHRVQRNDAYQEITEEQVQQAKTNNQTNKEKLLRLLAEKQSVTQ